MLRKMKFEVNITLKHLVFGYKLKHLTKIIWTSIIVLLYYPSQYTKRKTCMYQNKQKI
jgi:hypothetical protein